MANQLTLVEGRPAGLTVQEVAHLMVPGRHRTVDGMDISLQAASRVDGAAEFYLDHDLASRQGVIVASGYKQPGDNAGSHWTDETGEVFVGLPEAYGMLSRFVGKWGIDAASVITEPHSIDTVTNFTNTQSLYPDERPVGIVAQEKHLERILDIVAPKTMRRPYVGLVVPEVPFNHDIDRFSQRLASRWIVRGLDRQTPEDASQIAEARVLKLWAGVNTYRTLKVILHALVRAK